MKEWQPSRRTESPTSVLRFTHTVPRVLQKKVQGGISRSCIFFSFGFYSSCAPLAPRGARWRTRIAAGWVPYPFTLITLRRNHNTSFPRRRGMFRGGSLRVRAVVIRRSMLSYISHSTRNSRFSALAESYSSLEGARVCTSL